MQNFAQNDIKCLLKTKNKYFAATQFALWLLAFVICCSLLFAVCGVKLIYDNNLGVTGSAVIISGITGDGTSSNPYQIENQTQLKIIADKVNNESVTFSGSYFIVTADFSVGSTWSGIGSSSSKQFSGEFNGNYHTITFRGVSNGLFGYVGSSGVVKNLCVDSTSDLAYAFADQADDNAQFLNCINYARVVGSSSNSHCAGGIVNSGDVEVYNCANYGKVSMTYDGYSYVGGIVGSIGVGATIKNCYNTASISNTGSSGGYNYTGGIVGFAHAVQDGEVVIENCYNVGIVNGGFWKVLGNSTLLDGKITTSNNYYLSSSSGTSYDSTPKTAAELKKQSTYTNWDFVNVWEFKDGVNDGYPVLRTVVLKPETTDTNVTLTYSINSAYDVFVYVVDSNKNVVNQFVLTGKADGTAQETTFVVSELEQFTLLVYQTLYMTTKIDGTVQSSKTFASASDLMISLDITIAARDVCNWTIV